MADGDVTPLGMEPAPNTPQGPPPFEPKTPELPKLPRTPQGPPPPQPKTPSVLAAEDSEDDVEIGVELLILL